MNEADRVREYSEFLLQEGTAGLRRQIERAREKLKWMRWRYRIVDGAPMFERDSVLVDVCDLEDILSEDETEEARGV